MRASIIIALLVFATTVMCQTWERLYPFKLYSLVALPDSTFLISGGWNRNGILIKVNRDGDVVWTRVYNPDTTLWEILIKDLCLSGDGNIYLTGTAIFTGTERKSIYCGKIGYNGDSLWIKMLDSIHGLSCFPNKVTASFNGNCIILGECEIVGGENCPFLICLNPNGDTIWEKVYYDYVGWYPYGIATSRDNGFLFVGVGRAVGEPALRYDLFIVKTDSNGVILWDKTYGDYWDWEDGHSIAHAGDNSYIIAGGQPLRLFRITDTGDTLWTKIYGSSSWANDICRLSSGGYSVTGKGRTPLALGDIPLIRLDENGDTIWTKTFHSADTSWGVGKAVCETFDGGFVLLVLCEACSYLIKTDSLGNVDWIREIPQKLQSISLNVFPNPFNSSCVISAPAGSDVEIYDVNGRFVWSSPIGASGDYPQRGDLSPRKIMWEPDESVKSGIYFVRAVIGDRAITRRVVLMR